MRFIFSVTFLTISVTACISAPPKKQNIVEQVKQENATGLELSKDFEAKLKLRTDPAIDKYLLKITNRLEKSSGDPRLADTPVAMIQDQNGQWSSFGIPGKRVYLSVGWLKKTQTDSEVAALIALELGRIQQRQLLNHLESPADPKLAKKNDDSAKKDPKKRPQFFGENGLFTYNQKEMDAAIASAVSILYKAGFDPRGLGSNFEVEKNNLDHSVYTENFLLNLIDSARDSVDTNPPLINPIVRTREFATIRKRIQNL